MLKFQRLFAIGLCCLGFSGAGLAANDDPYAQDYGVPDTSMTEYGEYSYMRGDWEATMITIDADGNRSEIPGKAYVTGFYHRDGKIFQTCFATDTFFSTDIRAYDTEKGEWRAHFLNANAQRWNGFTVQKVGDTMQTIVPGGFSGTEAFDVKSVVDEIAETGFRSKVYRSDDGHETWAQTFELIYRRAAPESGVRTNC